jgi:TolB protein
VRTSSTIATLAALFLLTATLAAPAARAIDIVITDFLDTAIPVAVVPFGYAAEAGAAPLDFAQVIGADLARSGRFAPMPFADLPSRPSEFSAVNFKDWRLVGIDFIVIGRVLAVAADRWEVEFRLLDVVRGTQMFGYKIPTDIRHLRLTAHRIADLIYEKLTGERGAFATRIAYVTVQGKGDPKRGGRGRTYKLYIADSDGANAQEVVTSQEPLLSPAWSADGRRLAYVSFITRNSAIWVRNLETQDAQQISGGAGINSAPAWSPDGRRLALTLSKDGNPEIYVLDVATRVLRRITNDPAIDTEPNWAPDGQSLLFTSDRAGGPQIFSVNLGDGAVRRVTINKGGYNARPRYSPDGKRIAMVHGDNQGYRIAVLEVATDRLTLLTDTRQDESPSFAPNGSMIIYTTTRAQGTELAQVSADGRFKFRLTQSGGEVREPDWGPIIQ